MEQGVEAAMKCILTFDAGTVLLEGDQAACDLAAHYTVYDERVRKYRAKACDYTPIMRLLYAAGVEVEDRAKDYTTISLTLKRPLCPMPHQTAALEAWKNNKSRGTVVMPTGSGKTYFAFMAMNLLKRPTLVVVPTIDLLQQWASNIERAFGVEAGMLGGGSHEIRDITVSTYDSAVLNMEFIGAKFAFAVYDECHHLPGPVNRTAATMALAPYRLGLTATPEREDGGMELMERIIGRIVYRCHIDELEGNVLSEFVTERIEVELSEKEFAEYTAARKVYMDFVKSNGIDFREPDAWKRFIVMASVMRGGREAMKAFLKQRETARCSDAKIDVMWDIIRGNPEARIIVFTADNDTAYRIGETFCLPVLTHKTKAFERKEFLDSFRSGDYPVIVTSKVLNEGVDVPEANIAIVISGSAGTREHIQRLGRILRRGRNGKMAILYELVSANTSEMGVSERRRQSRPWQGRE